MKYKEFKETFLNPTQNDSIENFNGWEAFSTDDWEDILCEQPQFEKKAKEYKNGWLALLIEKPELASKCDKWEEFNTVDWSRLLSEQPQFADKYDKWEEFSVSNWKTLLLAQPQFVNNCPDTIYDEFSPADWKIFEYRIPESIKERYVK